MSKFGRFEKKSHLRGVQINPETEIGRLRIHRRIFYALSETFSNIGDVYPRSACLMARKITSGLFEQRVRHAAFLLPKNVQIPRVMQTINLSQVTPEAVAQQKTLVDNLYASLMRRIHSDDFEVYRQKWAKARALLSEMQGALYFARKEVCANV